MARVVIPGCPHHVTQRGNRREDVFFAVADRKRYLELLGEYAAKGGLAVANPGTPYSFSLGAG